MWKVNKNLLENSHSWLVLDLMGEGNFGSVYKGIK